MTRHIGSALAAAMLCGCGLLPAAPAPKPETCRGNASGVVGPGTDKAGFDLGSPCVEIYNLTATWLNIKFPPGGPIDFLDIQGRNPSDLNFNQVGEYKCESLLDRLVVNGSPTDNNPAYDQGSYCSRNQNTAVAGDCLYGACTVTVTSAATSGQLSLHFTGHLARGKAGYVPPFYCDYLDLSFDFTTKITTPLE